MPGTLYLGPAFCRGGAGFCMAGCLAVENKVAEKAPAIPCRRCACVACNAVHAQRGAEPVPLSVRAAGPSCRNDPVGCRVCKRNRREPFSVHVADGGGERFGMRGDDCPVCRRTRIRCLDSFQGTVRLDSYLPFATAVLALIAERNFVLFMPVFLCGVVSFCNSLGPRLEARVSYVSFLVMIAFLLGLWVRSLFAYDSSMIAFQRVPVDAAAWMASHPHEGRLFNDDRAGGYLAFVNPNDSVYIDGRFILKTADFFERYLRYADEPALFMHDADSLRIGRAIFPLRYYARWGNLVSVLVPHEDWEVVYRDSLYIVLNHSFRNLVSER